MGVPLAWLQLTREKRRLLAAVSGISFAVVLMLTQLGFQDALIGSSGMLHSRLRGDLILIHPRYQNILWTSAFTERRLFQALGVEGVESVEPVYVGVAPFKNPFNLTERGIFMIAFNPRSASLDAPGVAENLEKIRIPGAVLFDSIHRPEYGAIGEALTAGGPVKTEVAGRQVEVVGTFQLGTSFGADGNLIMSDETFLQVIPRRQRGIIDIGLIKLKLGADPGRSKAQIAEILPADVRLLTHAEFVALERNYWMTNTPIGFVFRLGVLMGMFVGCIIVYQILYSDVSSHLPEYATLKAMGYRDRFLYEVVLQESVILSVCGFLPGVFVSHFVYVLSRNATLLPLQMSTDRVAAVYLLTLIMCVISGALAMRRLRAADPAESF